MRRSADQTGAAAWKRIAIWRAQRAAAFARDGFRVMLEWLAPLRAICERKRIVTCASGALALRITHRGSAGDLACALRWRAKRAPYPTGDGLCCVVWWQGGQARRRERTWNLCSAVAFAVAARVFPSASSLPAARPWNGRARRRAFIQSSWCATKRPSPCARLPSICCKRSAEACRRSIAGVRALSAKPWGNACWRWAASIAFRPSRFRWITRRQARVGNRAARPI